MIQIRLVTNQVTVAEENLLIPLREVARQHVANVLDGCGWNKNRAARVLEVDVKTVNKKIRDFGITRADCERALE